MQPDLLLRLQAATKGLVDDTINQYSETSLLTKASNIFDLLTILKKEPLAFNVLIDLCVVDYLHFGKYDWDTKASTGYSRAIQKNLINNTQADRFAVVYHLLSSKYNARLRVKAIVDDDSQSIASITPLWQSANWYEREAFDLFGIKFIGHPNLSRILTDYAFQDHPFRKDFPMSGHLEMRYDGASEQIVYEPVVLEDKAVMPKVFRENHRYQDLDD